MNDFEIVFYQRANGECPVSEFLDSLNKVMRFKMMHQMDLLELYGNHPRGDYSKFVDEGIFELRAQTRTDITRIMFFFDENRRIVLTNGFVKKTQKMPMSEFELAKKYRADYLSRRQEMESAQKSSRTTSCPQWRPKLDDIVSSADARRSPALSRDTVPRDKDR